MKVAFYGGQTAGIVVLLTLLAKRYSVNYVIPEDDGIKNIALGLQLPIYPKNLLNNEKFINNLKNNIDLLICCHGRKILTPQLVNTVKCINIHPCLYKYKGARPIKRLIRDKNPKASVASHYMTEQVDLGKVIIERFINIPGVESKTEAEIYHDLYPLYESVIIETLNKLG